MLVLNLGLAEFLKTAWKFVGVGLDHEAEFLGLGNKGRVLLGPGFGLVLGLRISNYRKWQGQGLAKT